MKKKILIISIIIKHLLNQQVIKKQKSMKLKMKQ